MTWLFNLLNGRKTYLSAIGLVILGGVQIYLGQYTAGIQSLLAALGAAGLRHAVAKATASAALDTHT